MGATITSAAVIKGILRKTVLFVAIAGLLYCVFQSACMRNGEPDLLWLWILFGPHWMFVWIVPDGGSLGGGMVYPSYIGCTQRVEIVYYLFSSYRQRERVDIQLLRNHFLE